MPRHRQPRDTRQKPKSWRHKLPWRLSLETQRRWRTVRP